MIFADIIMEALTPESDPLRQAKEKVQTRAVGAIIRERYEALHGGALQRVRASVPTAPGSSACSGPAS